MGSTGQHLFQTNARFQPHVPTPDMDGADDDEVQHKRTITLTDARLHLGKSNFTLNGEISQIRKAMLRGGKLKGNFNLNSDYIDCNQLMQAVNNGMQYGENTDLLMLSDENIAQLNTESLQDSIAQTETDTTSQLFVLPAFLDVALHTNAKRIDFKDLELENVVGDVVLRDERINLSKLNIQSNMGNGNLTMVYRAKNGQEATAGLDLDMEDVKVEKLIALLPFHRHISPDAPFVRRCFGLSGHGYLQDGFDHVSHYAVQLNVMSKLCVPPTATL